MARLERRQCVRMILQRTIVHGIVCIRRPLFRACQTLCLYLHATLDAVILLDAPTIGSIFACAKEVCVFGCARYT